MITKELNKKILAFFLSIVFTIIFLHITLSQVRVFGKHDSIFYMDSPISLANYYVTVVSFISGSLFLLFLATSKLQIKQKIIYIIFSLFLFALSLDEYIEIHEASIDIVKKYVSDTDIVGILELSWVMILLIPILAFVGFVIFSIFKEKNPIVKRLFILGVVFFALILVSEVIGVNSYSHSDLYFSLVTLEESSEMFCVTTFLYASLEKLLENITLKG